MARATIPEFHEMVLGTAPTAEQVRLYNQFPDFRGISDRTQDPEVAEAVLLLALRTGTAQDRVFVLAPQSHEEWLLARCEAMAMTCFDGCRKYPPSRAKELIYGYTCLFQKLKMTGRLLQLREEPQHWVSFGFAVDDLLPAWMSNRLLACTE